jgi:hypothetical protein
MSLLPTGGPPFPHCSTAVLHAPGVCQYCDQFPQLQNARTEWGLEFTRALTVEELLTPPHECKERILGIACLQHVVDDTRGVTSHNGRTKTANGGELLVTWTYVPPERVK